MKDARPLRLPIQVGGAAAGAIARAAAAICSGVVLTVAAWTVFGLELIGGLLVMAIGVQLVVAGAVSLRRAFATRAADALLSARGLALDGGPRHGMSIDWQAIEPGSCQVNIASRERFTVGHIFGNLLFAIGSMVFEDKLAMAPPTKVRVGELLVARRGEPAQRIAETDLAEEHDALHALRATIEARLGTEQPAPTTADPRIVRCSACGAPLLPRDADQVPCSYCRAPNAVPPELRAKLRQAHQLQQSQQRSSEVVAKLLDQPGAHRANAVLTLLGIAMVVVWLLVGGLIGAAALYGVRDVGFEVGLLLLLGLTFTVSLYLFSRLALADRTALRLVTLGFGAAPPRRAGEPYACRNCGAPLDDGGSRLVVRCVYCQNDNVIGVDVSRAARAEQSQQQSLDAALQRRRQARTTWWIGALGALTMSFFGVMLVSVSVDTVLITAAKPSDCEAGDMTACARVGEKFLWGEGVESDYPKAAWALEKACAGDHVRSCWLLAGMYDSDDWALPKDLAKAREYLEKACKGGEAAACRDLEKL